MSANLQSDVTITPATRIAHELKVNQWSDDFKDSAQEIVTRVEFLKERVRASNTKGLVLGISGGLRSGKTQKP